MAIHFADLICGDCFAGVDEKLKISIDSGYEDCFVSCAYCNGEDLLTLEEYEETLNECISPG